jgi:hypothetical protein
MMEVVCVWPILSCDLPERHCDENSCVLVCREEGPADYLHVSLDQGQCFYSIRLKPVESPDTELFINNILVEPDGAATIVHVTGSEHVKSLVRSLPLVVLIRPKALPPPRALCTVHVCSFTEGQYDAVLAQVPREAPFCQIAVYF